MRRFATIQLQMLLHSVHVEHLVLKVLNVCKSYHGKWSFRDCLLTQRYRIPIGPYRLYRRNTFAVTNY